MAKWESRWDVQNNQEVGLDIVVVYHVLVTLNAYAASLHEII